MENMQAVISHLRALGKGEIKPFDGNSGICNELFNLFGMDMGDYISFLDWPGNDRESPWNPVEGSFYDYSLNKEKWNPDTKHGRRRLDLCLWIADQLEEKYNEL